MDGKRLRNRRLFEGTQEDAEIFRRSGQSDLGTLTALVSRFSGLRAAHATPKKGQRW